MLNIYKTLFKNDAEEEGEGGAKPKGAQGKKPVVGGPTQRLKK